MVCFLASSLGPPKTTSPFKGAGGNGAVNKVYKHYEILTNPPLGTLQQPDRLYRQAQHGSYTKPLAATRTLKVPISV